MMGAVRKAGLVAAVSAFALAIGACTPGEPTAEAQRSDGGTPTAAQLAARLVEEMGGRDALEGIETLVRRGFGTRTRMGQIAETGGEDPAGELRDVTETIDFANGRAAFDYDVVSGEFTQHRTEVFTSYEGNPVGWNTGPGRPNIVTSPNGIFSWATQNSPEMLLRRNVVAVALAAADTADTAGDSAAEERPLDGRPSLYAPARLQSGEEIGLYFDPESGLLNGYTALDTETMLGDVEAEYVFDDWRAVGDVTLPHSLTIRKEGRPYSSIEYSSIAVNDVAALEIFEIPQDALPQAQQAVAAEGSWAPLRFEEVAPGIHHAIGYSHHSMVVEFPSFVAVVEAPYTEAQSATLARMIDEQIGKPIRYVVPSHPHYDHTGGLRRVVAVGATALLAAGHEAELRPVVEAPHTQPPDELARLRAAGENVGGIEVFSGERVIEEGERRLEIYEVSSIPHVNPIVLAFVADAGALFQSDVFFGAPSPDATALYEAIRERDLDVSQIVGGHGGVIPFETLEGVAAP
jgi:glyoxylase-like metal-dependent hydrolase (beta-lactamase superfamily II)